MTALQDGDSFLKSMDWTEVHITTYFSTKEAAALYAENIHQNAAQDEIWLSTTITTQANYEDYFAITVIISFSDGISEMMLTKLRELLNTSLER